MSQMETAIAYYKKTNDNYRKVREKYREQEASLSNAKSDVRRFEMEIAQQESDLPGFVGTGQEDAALQNIENLKASLRRAKDLHAGVPHTDRVRPEPHGGPERIDGGPHAPALRHR